MEALGHSRSWGVRNLVSQFRGCWEGGWLSRTAVCVPVPLLGSSGMKPLSRSPPPPVLIYSWTRSAERNPCPLQPVGGAVLEQGSCAGRPGLAWGSLAQVGGGRRRYLGGLPPSVDGDLGRAGAEQRTRQSWGADSWEGRELGGLPRRERVWVGGGGG